MVFLAFLYKSMEVDIMLKYYELCGKKVEELQGQVVWITGASSGIGEHLAYKLASVGCKLILSSRRKDELERVKIKCFGEDKMLNIPMCRVNIYNHNMS
jgi:dehydrogenase/reductase SDR family protein 7